MSGGRDVHPLARSREKPLRLRPRHHPHESRRLLCHQLHRPLQSPPEAIQQHLTGTETSAPSKSSIQNPESPPPSPDRLPDQVAILRKLITGYDKSVVTPDAEALSGIFGHKNKKRTEQIEVILETLKGLGQL